MGLDTTASSVKAIGIDADGIPMYDAVSVVDSKVYRASNGETYQLLHKTSLELVKRILPAGALQIGRKRKLKSGNLVD